MQLRLLSGCRDLYIIFAVKVLESYNYFRCLLYMALPSALHSPAACLHPAVPPPLATAYPFLPACTSPL
jgi:hypothetical protein